MTREEEIKNAAKAYISGDTLSIQYLMHFENGAGWADEHPKNVWHPASEEPKDGKRICVHFGEDNCGIYTRSGKGKNEWRNWCKVVHALRWAYISDLLPKGGEQ